MKTLDRITINPAIMGGKACIRGMRVTVGTVVGLLAAGRSPAEILRAYPYLEPEDIDQSLAYAAWRLEEREVPLAPSVTSALSQHEADLSAGALVAVDESRSRVRVLPI